MANAAPLRFKSIIEFHNFRKLPKPEHPLVSVINVGMIKRLQANEPISLVLDFYCIALKKNFNATMKYGQQQYDFNEGMMSFVAPGQVFSISVENSNNLDHSGWILYFHPDFLWNTPLAKKIKQYKFFDYAVHEALFLSPKEEESIANIILNIEKEYHANIDAFTQDLIIAQLEVLLTYAERFYHRQFITRKISNHTVLSKLENLLSNYFDQEDLIKKGLPTVKYVSEALNVSPNYLSGLLKVLTGKSTQQHIQDKMIEKAKEKLSTTHDSVSEIAYALGFEYPQSFSKLFKTKTNLSPLEFRHSFN
ncbi:helix-turn-helix domain-containing protein [Pedobacter sp. GSP4]|uniref:helix-turn-helix domain-containing protein n=1 Tax=Pedobacter sp. GSP4 TaxID=3453716 RepID=UPI003EE91587